MRRSIDPADPGFIGDTYPGCFVRLNGQVFNEGTLITVDSETGEIVYAPVHSDGFSYGNDLRVARGKVEIYDLPPSWARKN